MVVYTLCMISNLFVSTKNTCKRVEVISQVLTQILIKFYLLNLYQAPTSKSQPNRFMCLTDMNTQNHQKRKEDRIANGYQLKHGQPWYAGLGFNKDPRSRNKCIHLISTTTKYRFQPSRNLHRPDQGMEKLSVWFLSPAEEL